MTEKRAAEGTTWDGIDTGEGDEAGWDGTDQLRTGADVPADPAP